MAKNLPAMQETRVRSLGREDPLEKGKAGHSSILARRIPRTEEPGGLQSVGSESDTTERLTFSLLHYSYYTNITSFKVLTLEASHMYFWHTRRPGKVLLFFFCSPCQDSESRFPFPIPPPFWITSVTIWITHVVVPDLLNSKDLCFHSCTPSPDSWTFFQNYFLINFYRLYYSELFYLLIIKTRYPTLWPRCPQISYFLALYSNHSAKPSSLTSSHPLFLLPTPLAVLSLPTWYRSTPSICS